jgi:hypothetical protein
MDILSYQNSLRWYAIKNRISRTIFENRNALIFRAALVATVKLSMTACFNTCRGWAGSTST